jgi:hypothetical protein
MPVVGSEAYILADLGKTLDVYPYTPDYKPMKVKMVDAAVRYESPFDGKVYILVIRCKFNSEVHYSRVEIVKADTCHSYIYQSILLSSAN